MQSGDGVVSFACVPIMGSERADVALHACCRNSVIGAIPQSRFQPELSDLHSVEFQEGEPRGWVSKVGRGIYPDVRMALLYHVSLFSTVITLCMILRVIVIQSWMNAHTSSSALLASSGSTDTNDDEILQDLISNASSAPRQLSLISRTRKDFFPLRPNSKPTGVGNASLSEHIKTYFKSTVSIGTPATVQV